MRCVFGTPSPAELVPSPYKQGESAIRYFFYTILVSLFILSKHQPYPIQRLNESINIFL